MKIRFEKISNRSFGLTSVALSDFYIAGHLLQTAYAPLQTKTHGGGL